MKCIKNRVAAEFERGCIGSNTNCPYHPCHHRGQDCTYCYCPFYPCMDEDLGKMLSDGKKEVWDCSDCLFIHRTRVCAFISEEVCRIGISDPGDERLAGILKDAKKRFFGLGHSIMVLGATSDAGKSLTAAALCRIIADMGYTVTPMKTQNMSLNSVVTHDGSEIAMIQALQARAAGIKRPGYHINPILMKPKGDTISQVMVHGKPFGDHDAASYYRDFVPGPGTEAVKESIRFLRERYDYVVMEGAGSPAEINIYEKDIANMKAAEMADADCVLVVNTERGGSFAYALGTIELLEMNDKKRIKGIIFNNLRGDPSGFLNGVEEFKRFCDVPVLGVVPHLDLYLPNEDSAFFQGTTEIGSGSAVISVIKLPRISNFTDFDPLCLEDVTVRFVNRPEQLEGSDAVIIPGTKNTISDLNWLKETGMADAITSLKGKVPILGICGGYQMMGSLLADRNGLEGSEPSDTEGLGLFDDVTEWTSYRKNVRQVKGSLIPTGEDVRGYEIHMGDTLSRSQPLFSIDEFGGRQRREGSFIEDDMIFGTYLHGVFDAPSFRRYFLSFTPFGGSDEPKDHSMLVEQSLQKLADEFSKALDMDLFKRSLMEGRK